MKERHNSEKGLKNAFDNYQMPFDNDAFDKFKAELDKEEKRRKFIWWMYYGKIIAPIVILGVALLAFVYLPDFNKNPKRTSATTIKANSVKESIENHKKDVEVVDLKNRTIDTNNGEKKTPISVAGDVQHLESKNDNKVSSVKHFDGVNGSTTNDVGSLNKARVTVDNSNSTTVSDALNQHDLLPLKTPENRSSTLVLSKGKDDNGNKLNPLPNRKIEDTQLLNRLGLSKIESKNQQKFVPFEGQIIPFKGKYKKHFYFHLGIGASKEDNSGINDQFFEVLKPNEFIWYASTSYQLNTTTSFELGLMRKNLTLGYRLKDLTYSEITGNKVSIVRASMVNKIWSPSPKLNLNMSNGISMVIVTKDFNNYSDFSKTISDMNVPDYISKINLDREGLYSNNHFMYFGGLSLDYSLSQNVALNIGAEYSLGFKSIMKADLKYIEGEGIIKNVETQTNASFALISLGLKYRLRKD